MNNRPTLQFRLFVWCCVFCALSTFSCSPFARKQPNMPPAFYEWTHALEVMTQNLLDSIKKYDNGFDWYTNNRSQYLEISKRLKLLRWQAEGTLNNPVAAQQILKIEETLFAVKKLYMGEENNYRGNLKYLPSLENIFRAQYGKLRDPDGKNSDRMNEAIARIR